MLKNLALERGPGDEEDDEDDEDIDLGSVSVDTHGAIFGPKYDGGWGVRL